MNRTPIEWTHFSANALKLELPDGTRVNACTHISEGCRHCYAESLVRRFWKKAWGDFPGYSAALLKLGRPVLVEEELQVVLRLSQRIADGKADPTINRVFWHDMTDEFLSFWPDEMLDRIWAVRALATNLIHQVLTKRPDRAATYLNTPFRSNAVLKAMQDVTPDRGVWSWPGWSEAMRGVWLGTSIENQATADERIPHLLRCPAVVRFISAEPLLGPLHIDEILVPFGDDGEKAVICPLTGEWAPEEPSPVAGGILHWCIIGGESGHGARPFNVQWARDIIAQCKAAGVACFVKQLGAHPVEDNSGASPGSCRRYQRIPCRLKDKKGGDWSEWPEDLRVRQFPTRNV